MRYLLLLALVACGGKTATGPDLSIVEDDTPTTGGIIVVFCFHEIGTDYALCPDGTVIPDQPKRLP